MSNKWVDQNKIPEDVANIIFKIRVELPNKTVFERDFRPDVNIDYDMLEEEMEKTPSNLAFWSGVLAEQKFVVAKLNRLIARRRSVICEEALGNASKDGGRVTKYVLDEIVEADDTMLELQSQLMLAERCLSKLYGVVDSIKNKSELLRSLAGFKRQELKDS